MDNDDQRTFWHTCFKQGCDRDIQYDDEPFCFEHSPEEGSSLLGFSARTSVVRKFPEEFGEVTNEHHPD